MEATPFDFIEIAPDIWIYRGAVNTGILRAGQRAVLIDCDDTLTPARLAQIGVGSVERIYCTQHRRPNTAGAAAFSGAAVFAPQGERAQFAQANAYWQDGRSRWHLYHARPGPLAPLEDIPLAGTVTEGEAITWGGFCLRVLDTPGMTSGAVSYVVETESSAGRSVIFSGDVLYAAGQVWDVHALQQNNGAFSDYHGFLGAAPALMASQHRLGALQAEVLVPSHGPLIRDHAAAALQAAERLELLTRNYAATSSLNHYFPHILERYREDPWRMPPAPVTDFPAYIRPVAFTSFAIVSQTGALFLIDCGHDSVLETLAAWKETGQYSQLEGCWVTHYHDDHVDSLHRLAASSGAPIYADQHMAEVLAHPARFILPCISPAAAPVTHITHEGETWRWHEFEFTAMHLPGQTYYHGGLLVRAPGQPSVLISGDSFSPAGLDDYTAGNRNFLGAGAGFRRCLDLLRQYQPDLILNQHQQKAFHFSPAQIDYLEQMLVERERMLADLLPWEHPNFGTDEGWLRAYPYDVAAFPGADCVLEVRATNHAGAAGALGTEAPLAVEPVLPPGWSFQALPAFTADELDEPQIRARLIIHVPLDAAPGCCLVAFRVTWQGRYLGQACHALIHVQ